jgi:hypothetical protein
VLTGAVEPTRVSNEAGGGKGDASGVELEEEGRAAVLLAALMRAVADTINEGSLRPVAATGAHCRVRRTCPTKTRPGDSRRMALRFPDPMPDGASRRASAQTVADRAEVHPI